LSHQIHPAIVFREGHHIANRFRAAKKHDQPIEAERDPAVRRLA